MTNWDSSLVEKIYSEKISEKSEDRDNLLILTSKQLYGDKVHYALELIQNAEDEGSNTIQFIFENDHAVVVNDGRPFESDDVQGICSVRPGRKKNKIGFFGIGFKSVFNITKKPQIISGNYNFAISDYIYPSAEHDIPESVKSYYHDDKGSIFILPFSDGLPDSQELIKDFDLIDSKILLFLDNLNKLEFHDNVNKSHWVIERKPGENSEIILTDGRQQEDTSETRWRVFHKDIRVTDNVEIPEGKEGIAKTRITIAFPINEETREFVMQKGVLYCYLPTKKRTDLNFLLQADFLPTIGRENVADHRWNEWLIQEMGKWAADLFESLVSDEQLRDYIYDFIPLNEEIQDDLIEQFYTELTNSLKTKKIAKTTLGWTTPEKCAIQDSKALRDLINESDLKTVFNDRYYYIDASISLQDSNTRAESVLFELGAQGVDLGCLIALLKLEARIKNKPFNWFLDLYDYLSHAFPTSSKISFNTYSPFWNDVTKSLFDELRLLKFIYTNTKELVPLVDTEKPDRLICYPQNIDLSEINQIFTEGEIEFLHPYFQQSSIIHRRESDEHEEEKRVRVKDWLDNIGARKHFKQAHVIREVILPKFASNKYLNYDDRQLYQFINYIRVYWSAVETEINSKNFKAGFIDELKDTIKLKAFYYNGRKKINEYRKPSELYFSHRYGKNEVMEQLFRGIKGKHFLSPYYLDRQQHQARKKTRGRQREEYSWKKFTEILGVWSSPRVVKHTDRLPIYSPEYQWIDREYSTGGHFIQGDSVSNDIVDLIEYCSKINRPKANRDRLSILWDILVKNWKLYKDNQFCESVYVWHFRDYKSKKQQTSTFLEYLRDAEWVQGTDKMFHKPSALFVENNQNVQLLGKDTVFLTLKANEAFLRDIGVIFEPSLELTINKLSEYRNEHDSLKTNQLTKLATIYQFLHLKLLFIAQNYDESTKQTSMITKFIEEELLYLPRDDKNWWSPKNVYSKDLSTQFGTLRGYLENNGAKLYPDDLIDFFKMVGIKEAPLIDDCVNILDDLKSLEDIEVYKKHAPKIYQYINELIEEKDQIFVDQPVYLSCSNKFLSLSELVYIDNLDFGEYFKNKIEVLWIPYSWHNYQRFFNLGGFHPISEYVQIKKHLGKLSELDGDNAENIRTMLRYALQYLKNKDIAAYQELIEQNIRQYINNLEFYLTPKLVLEYSFDREHIEPILCKGIIRSAFLSIEEIRLYVLDTEDLLSYNVLKELSKLFGVAAGDVFLFLDSIMKVNDKDELAERLKQYNVDKDNIDEAEEYEPIEIITAEEEGQQDTGDSTEEDLTKTSQPEPKVKPKPPQKPPIKRDHGLIDPEKFYFGEIEDYVPYTSSEGNGDNPRKPVSLRKGRKVPPGQRPPSSEKPYRGDAEDIALGLVIDFEVAENRTAEDRHRQSGIGYDIYAFTDDGEERYIEVKHFRNDSGVWELTPHEWKKAEEQKEKYYVYIVCSLRKGSIPSISVIQDPIKYLSPDPPAQKKFSTWQNGVSQVIKCQPIESES